MVALTSFHFLYFSPSSFILQAQWVAYIYTGWCMFNIQITWFSFSLVSMCIKFNLKDATRIFMLLLQFKQMINPMLYKAIQCNTMYIIAWVKCSHKVIRLAVTLYYCDNNLESEKVTSSGPGLWFEWIPWQCDIPADIFLSKNSDWKCAFLHRWLYPSHDWLKMFLC